jgi:serine/threonine protein kinase/Flp pilus assembly protein TadD
MDFYPVGFRIANRYEVIQPPNLERGIRVGSIGFVYICRDTKKNQLVALKFFKPDHLSNLTARAHFLEEGNTWMQLGIHPHVVRCYNVRHMDPTVFLVLELIANDQYPDNASLYDWMYAPMPVDQALLFVLQIARGMQHAVEKIPGLVHCDLKPGNVLVNADTLPRTNINRLCVSDFGLLKIVTEGDTDTSKPNRDRSNRSLGTPEYMAPEQWNNESVGVYTDVYALGCILYDMLTGRHGRSESDPNEARTAHLNGKLRPMSRKVPDPVRLFLTRSLSLNSADRYQTWNEVTVALEELYSSLGVGPVPHASAEGEVDPEHFALASSFNAMGIHCAHMGKTRDAIEYFEKALAIFKEINHRQGEGAVLGNLGNTYSRLGRMDNALHYCEQDWAIARERKDRLRESIALGSIGEIYRNQGDARSAIGYQEQRLKIVREIGDLRGEGNTWSSLGMAYADLGDVTHALKYYKKQLVITRRIGDRRGRCNAWGNLGNAHFQLGEMNRAILFYDLYSKTAKKIGDWVGTGTAMGNLGSAYLALGDIKPAIDIFFMSLEIAREVGDRRGEGVALGSLGIAYAQLGETSRAFDYCKQRLEIATEIDDNDGLCSALFNIGLLYLQKGKVQDAILVWVNLYVVAREMNLEKALHRLEKLAPRVGLPKGLDGWERLVKTMQKQGTMKDFLKDLMKK